MIRINNLKILVENDNKEYIISKINKKYKTSITDYKIIKKSIDARTKDIFYVYTIDINIDNEDDLLSKYKDLTKSVDSKYEFNDFGSLKQNNRPIIVGSGPAGLFCAYLLALNNYNPIIIERGEKIEDRVKTVEHFFKTNELNEESNVQFGEGGAGTFSDGKLSTGIKDKENRIKFILETFVEMNAPEDILYLNKPHIGTDKLRDVIINLRNKIISLGGEFKYNTKLTNIILKNNKLEKIELNNKEIIDCDNLFLCIGHSARDTYKMLYDKKIIMNPKSFAIGVRVSHPQVLINKSLYKEKYNILPPASYKLTYQTKSGRGVYSFCMCPGGYVVNSSSKKDHLVVNGMSDYLRDTDTANSAIIVTITPRDFGNNPLDGIKFQKDLEQKAYKLGKGNIPVQNYIDYKNNIKSTKLLSNINIKGNYELSNLNELLPSYINDSLKEAFPYFSTKIKDYDSDEMILYGVETRTSAPLRIERDEEGLSSIEGIYPTGEGAGFAGGIISSAVDGMKQAENYMKKYQKMI